MNIKPCAACVYGTHEWHEKDAEYVCVFFCWKSGKKEQPKLPCSSFRKKELATIQIQWDFSCLTSEERNNLADNLERLLKEVN